MMQSSESGMRFSMDKKFSIIIPNYNKEDYVEETLNSIFNQTYKNYEVIVIDDASSDNSIEKIKRIRLGSVEQGMITEELLKRLKSLMLDYFIQIEKWLVEQETLV